jgi:glutamyl-tRNA reductase
MPLQIFGLNHNTAPVQIRERIIFSDDDIARALPQLLNLDGIEEVVLLSTCNRTEFYVVSSKSSIEILKTWLQNDQNLDTKTRKALFTLQKNHAIKHIFRVACGLDSIVLGEPQILGQLKDAYRQAQQAGSVGRQLSRLFQHTFSVAKKVRSDTKIGNNPVSVAYATVTLANQFFAGFSQHTALLIGAGVTIELVAKHLTSKGIGRIFVANRNINRAQALANKFRGFALPLSEIEGTLPEADILISSTASTNPVISLEQMTAAIQARKHKPVFAIDIAVPRDIDPKVSTLSDVYLYTIDDLDKVIIEGRNSREAAAIDANQILDDEVQRYLNMERSKEVSPIIAELHDHGDIVRNEVLKQARVQLKKGTDSNDVLEYATASLLKKMLHQPSVRLREAGKLSDRKMIQAARELFGIAKKNK